MTVLVFAPLQTILVEVYGFPESHTSKYTRLLPCSVIDTLIYEDLVSPTLSLPYYAMAETAMEFGGGWVATPHAPHYAMKIVEKIKIGYHAMAEIGMDFSEGW